MSSLFTKKICTLRHVCYYTYIDFRQISGFDNRRAPSSFLSNFVSCKHQAATLCQLRGSVVKFSAQKLRGAAKLDFTQIFT